VAEIARCNEPRKFAVTPKRRIVEHSLGWQDHFRRFWKNCERKLRAVRVILAFILVLVRRCLTTF